MLEYLLLLFSLIRATVRDREALIAENVLLRQQLTVLTADSETTSVARPRQALLARRSCAPPRLAPASCPGPTRERHPLASAGLAALLALALSRITGPSTAPC
jgi:hypothetical protein